MKNRRRVRVGSNKTWEHSANVLLFWFNFYFWDDSRRLQDRSKYHKPQARIEWAFHRKLGYLQLQQTVRAGTPMQFQGQQLKSPTKSRVQLWISASAYTNPLLRTVSLCSERNIQQGKWLEPAVERFKWDFSEWWRNWRSGTVFTTLNGISTITASIH